MKKEGKNVFTFLFLMRLRFHEYQEVTPIAKPSKSPRK